MHQVINGTVVFGDPIDNAVEQINKLVKPHSEMTALMADHHLGYSMPIGGVSVLKNKISPSLVGFDIGCGNTAMRLNNMTEEHVRPKIKEVMDEIQSKISFGLGGKHTLLNKYQTNKKISKEKRLESLLSFRSRISNYENIALAIKYAEENIDPNICDLLFEQAGTVGGGNHYVDIFSDENGIVWIGCHFGSRGFGHKVTSHFLELGGGKDSINAEPVLFDIHSYEGRMYFRLMSLAGDYASVCRRKVVYFIAEEILSYSGSPSKYVFELVENHHNYAWLIKGDQYKDGESASCFDTTEEEKYFSENLENYLDNGERVFSVIRKGATPNWPGMESFIGGSMADKSFIIKGKESTDTLMSLFSTVHGAGRAVSRSKAKGKKDKKTGEWKREPEIDVNEFNQLLIDNDVELRGGDLDEAPQCYKNIENVLSHHSDTFDILHTLSPMGVCMAGPDDFDPYKD